MSSFSLRNQLLIASATGHFTIEVFSGLLPVMFPVLVSALDLSYVQVGGVTTMFILAAAATQPFFGYLSDRFGSRWFSSLSILWIASFMAAAAFAQSYAVLVILTTLAGLASGAFHPAGATNAAKATQAAEGKGVSIFLASGNIGYAVGPFIGGAILTASGLGGTSLLILPALLIALFIYRVTTVPADRIKRIASQTASSNWDPAALPGLGALVILMALRAWIHIGFASYIPLLLVERSLTLSSSSRILSLLLFSVTVGTLLGGFVADRLNRRMVLSISLLLSVPLNVLFLVASEQLVPMLALLTGVFIGMPSPIILLIAQGLLPRRVGVASGLALGIAYVTGSLGTALTGIVAEHYTLSMSLLILGLTPLLSSLCVLALPGRSSAL